MDEEDRNVARYLQLAKFSKERGQLAGCQKFLILAAVSACRTGWLNVAEGCRAGVLAQNPHHLLNRWDTFPDALRDDEFAPFLKQLERFCRPERAETLLNELGFNPHNRFFEREDVERRAFSDWRV